MWVFFLRLQLLIAIVSAATQQFISKMVGCSQGRGLCCPGRNMSCATIQIPADSSFDTFDHEYDFGSGYLPNFGFFSVKRTTYIHDKPSFNRIRTSQSSQSGHRFFSDIEHGSGSNEGRVHEYLIQAEGSGLSGDKDMQKTFSYTVQKGSNLQPSKMDSQIYGTPSLCYCDSDCRVLGDCCDDYEYACPIQDCAVTQWTSWSQCISDKSVGPSCSLGIRTRTRFVVHKPMNGGLACPETTEKIYCPSVTDEKCDKPISGEISLLLPYNFSQARFDNYKQDQYYDQPSVVTELKSLTNDCFFLELEWISPTCQNELFNQYLQLKSSICAECQKRAKIHNENRRCTGEGIPDHESLWLDSQNEHCYGYWIRRKMVQGCQCSEHSNPAQSVILI